MCSSPGRLNRAQCGFGHENRVYLSGAGVVSIIAVLLWQGMDQKIQSRRQLCHVTVLQDYLKLKRIHATINRGSPAMPKKIQFEWELPDALVDELTHDRTEVAATIKVAAVLD